MSLPDFVFARPARKRPRPRLLTGLGRLATFLIVVNILAWGLLKWLYL